MTQSDNVNIDASDISSQSSQSRIVANTSRPWLQPWKPGQSGNPKGPPPNRGLSLIQELNRLPNDVAALREMARNEPNINKRAAARKLLQMLGRWGDKAWELILEHTNGKAIQRLVDLTPQPTPTLDTTRMSEQQILDLKALLALATNTNTLPNNSTDCETATSVEPQGNSGRMVGMEDGGKRVLPILSQNSIENTSVIVQGVSQDSQQDVAGVIGVIDAVELANHRSWVVKKNIVELRMRRLEKSRVLRKKNRVRVLKRKEDAAQMRSRHHWEWLELSAAQRERRVVEYVLDESESLEDMRVRHKREMKARLLADRKVREAAEALRVPLTREEISVKAQASRKASRAERMRKLGIAE